MTKMFLAEPQKKHDIDGAVFCVDGTSISKKHPINMTSISETNAPEIAIAKDVSYVK